MIDPTLRKQVEQAARLANLHDFIQGLPAGYDTPLGEGGIGLSGGQAQRLALARAFLKDASFLILDVCIFTSIALHELGHSYPPNPSGPKMRADALP